MEQRGEERDMPVVPKNTVPGPQTVRLPNIAYAQPHTAEAMGAITSALGNQARSIGNYASILGQEADSIGRRGDTRMKIIDAKQKGKQAMWRAIGRLGSDAIDFGFKLDAIYDRRDRQEAQSALTDFVSEADRRVFGHTDEETGHHVEGTIDAPYVQSKGGEPPSGPAISTERAIREMLQDENAPWAKLTPRAKRYFDQHVGQLNNTYMRQSMAAQAKTMQLFRQMEQSRATNAFLDHATKIGGGLDPATDQIWIQTVHDGAINITKLMFADYWDEDNQRWLSEEVEGAAKLAYDDFIQKATASRIDTFVQAAQVTEDKEMREAIIGKIIALADFTGPNEGDTPVLADAARLKVLESVEKIRRGAIQREVFMANEARMGLQQAFDNWLANPNDPSALDALEKAEQSPHLSPFDRQETMVKRNQAVSTGQVSMLRLLTDHSASPEERQRFHDSMTPTAKAMWAAAQAQSSRQNEYAFDMLKLQIQYGAQIVGVDRDGAAAIEYNLSPGMLRNNIDKAYAEGVINLSQREKLYATLEKAKTVPDYVKDEVIGALGVIQEITDGDTILPNTVLFMNGGGIDWKEEPTTRRYRGQEAIYIDKDTHKEKRFPSNKELSIDAKVITAVLEAVTKYHMTHPSGTDTLTTRELVQKLLLPGKDNPIPVTTGRRIRESQIASKSAKLIEEARERTTEQAFGGFFDRYEVPTPTFPEMSEDGNFFPDEDEEE